jgi:putative holliday junction resolvase
LITSSLAEFRAALPSGGRLLGLDLGTKTIGLALCDAGWRIASARETLKRQKFSIDKALLTTLIAQEQVEGLVLGLPLHMDGSESPRAQASRAFARNMQDLALPLLLWDERWSSSAVTRTLIEADTRRAKRAEVVDKLAAAYILQGAIDALRYIP